MRGWYSRGYLPHFDGPHVPQMVAFRLADSLPASKVEAWRDELQRSPPSRLEAALRRRIEKHLDEGHGSAALREGEVAQVVQDTLLRFDGERHFLHAWVVMPTHVHVLLTVAEGHELYRVIHSWKSFTASVANRLLRRRGASWQREYFDRFIRNARHHDWALRYIEENPVAAGLCARPEDWLFGSARFHRDTGHVW